MFDALQGKMQQAQLIMRLMKDAHFKALISHPKVQTLLNDPEFQQVIRSQDLAKITSPSFAGSPALGRGGMRRGYCCEAVPTRQRRSRTRLRSGSAPRASARCHGHARGAPHPTLASVFRDPELAALFSQIDPQHFLPDAA